MKNKKKILLFTFIAFLMLIFSYYSFKILKIKYVMNDYFKQGRWEQLRDEYRKNKKTRYSSLFFGDSMTENFKQYMPESDSVKNMGISGDFSAGLIKRIDNVINFQPDKVFIMIGINDIIEKVPLSEIEDNYLKILELIKKNCPSTKIYIQSTLPTVGLRSLLSSSKSINKTVQKLNTFLKQTAKEKTIVYIDMYSDFINDNNELRSELTTDGIHLSKKAYLIWKSHLKDYITVD